MTHNCTDPVLRTTQRTLGPLNDLSHKCTEMIHAILDLQRAAIPTNAGNDPSTHTDAVHAQLGHALNTFDALRECTGEALQACTTLCDLNIELHRETDENTAPPPSNPATSYRVITDGSCTGNPGPGGWAAIIQTENGQESVLKGLDPQTTNNQMELTGPIEALESLPEGATVELITDSQYVRNGLERWIADWKRNGWRTTGKKPVKNQALWRRLDTARSRVSLTITWVRGHSGHPDNERADTIAQAQANNAKHASPIA